MAEPIGRMEMKKTITTKMKIIIALAATILLDLAAIGAYKLWRAYATEKNYSYEVCGDHVELVKYLGHEKHVRVPDTLKGKPVTVIRERCFFENEKIKTVHMGRNIREVGKEAFGFCYSLERVIGEAQLETISERTFTCCLYLKAVTVGNRVKRIETMAFFRCGALNSIGEQPELEYIGDGAFGDAGPLGDFRVSEHMELGWRVFHGSKWLENQTQAFVVAWGCLLAYNGEVVEDPFWGRVEKHASEVVEVPYGVVKVADFVFEGCETAGDIKEIRLPVTVEEVDTRAFANCGEVRVYMPESVTAIDTYSLRTEPNEKFSYLGGKVTIITTSGSYAEEYAKKYGVKYEIVEPWW